MNPVQLAREYPPRLVRLFKQAESKSCRTPGELLSIACQLLHLATNGLVVSHGCSGVTFEFEGYRTHAVVTLIAVTDAQGEFILALDLLQKWKPDGEHRLDDILEKAAEADLDRHLPKWHENEGADGHQTIEIGQAPNGRRILAPPQPRRGADDVGKISAFSHALKGRTVMPAPAGAGMRFYF